MNKTRKQPLSEAEISYIIEMAWMDNLPFEAIKHQFGLLEKDVKKIMRKHLKRSSFIMWRKRVTSKVSKKHSNKNKIANNVAK
jgi:uncharacterized protein (TIGR03643 family)